MREICPATGADKPAAKPECRDQGRLVHDEATQRVKFTLNLIEISEIVLESHVAHAVSNSTRAVTYSNLSG
jgi:hypothetical protein